MQRPPLLCARLLFVVRGAPSCRITARAAGMNYAYQFRQREGLSVICAAWALKILQFYISFMEERTVTRC